MTDLRTRLDSADPADPSVVVLRGELDMATAPAVAVTVASRLRAGCRHLTIDLSDVTFLDSQGLNALVKANVELAAAGGELRLRSPSKAARATLRLSGLDRLLPIDT
jgi:stage II sporulation protein AA (anti-sigma F factor antagonist)